MSNTERGLGDGVLLGPLQCHYWYRGRLPRIPFDRMIEVQIIRSGPHRLPQSAVADALLCSDRNGKKQRRAGRGLEQEDYFTVNNAIN